MFHRLLLTLTLLTICSSSFADGWKKHVVHEGEHCNAAVGGDFTGDGLPDVISNSGGKTRLFIAPDWKVRIIDETEGHSFIHAESFDVDDDGDLDFIGARYMPGLVAWLENPGKGKPQPWKARIVDDKVMGIHGLLKGDVDGDGKFDLLANSAQPVGDYPYSGAWLKVPKDPHSAAGWHRNIFADNDAPGLSHYLGFGDVNGDGRADIAMGAKGGPQDKSNMGEWFMWWEASADPSKPFKRHRLPGVHPGATNIQQADVNGDGKVDFIASRGHGLGLIWFENPSWKIHEINTELEFPHCLQVLDMDADGDVDAATCAYGSEIAAWFENDGKGKFKTHVVATEQQAYDIRAIDIDLDKDMDLLIAGRGSKNVVWYENPRISKRVAAAPEKVFLLIGQSNMAGRAHLIDGDEKPIGSVQLLDDNGKWIPATNPLNRFASNRKVIGMQRMSPGAGFAAHMTELLPQKRIGLISNARGGTSIEQWEKGKPLYDNTLKRIRSVPNVRIAGIIWHQGEANRNDPKYIDKLVTLIDSLRNDLDDPTIPFVAGEIYGEALVNDLLAELPKKVPHTGLAQADGLKVFDKVHFDRAGQLTLGKRYAEQMLRLMKK